ncbi:hypothetical protein DW083_02135 [Parabacteroides sp. AF48-14]|nr:hypothetical protein DW083_02135 [Parabacteroides sp. AF48-14]
MSPRLTRSRKRTGLINQLFIRSVLMRSRVKRGNRAVLTHPHLCRGGLLYKTYFSGSKGIRNKINVNPLFGPQKGTFSPFLSVFNNYDRPLCHCDRANV